MNSRLVPSLLRLRRNVLQNSATSYSLLRHVNYATIAAARRAGATNTAQNQQICCLNSTLALSRQTQFETRQLNVENVIQKLNAHYEQQGYVKHEHFKLLLEKLEQQATTFNQLLDEKQMLFLLNACGELMPTQQPKERMALFERFWQYLQRHAQLKKEHFLVKLHVVQQNQLAIEDLQDFLRELTALNVALTPQIFSELLAVAAGCGNMNDVSAVLTEMRQQEFALTERDFASLMLANVLAKLENGCQDVLASMQAANVPASSTTQATLVLCALLQQQYEEASAYLAQYQGQLSVTQVMSILRMAMLHVSLPQNVLQQLLQQLPASYTTGTEVHVALRNLCQELLHSGKLNAVTDIIKLLPKPVFAKNQSIDTFGVFLLHALNNAAVHQDKIIVICQLLLESQKNARALHIASEIAMRRSPPSVLPYFEALLLLEPLRPHYFWPLLMYNFRRHGESGLFRTLQHMSNLKVDCDMETLSVYILPRLSVTLENAELALKKFNEVGAKTSLVMTPIVAHLLSQQKYNEAHALLELYKTKVHATELVQPLAQQAVNVRATKRFQQFAKLLTAIYKKRSDMKSDFVGELLCNMFTRHEKLLADLPAVQDFINHMKRHDLCISMANFVTLKSCFTSCSDENSVQQIFKTLESMVKDDLQPNEAMSMKHPRDMCLPELESHLIELQSKRMNTRGVLRRLLQLCVRDGHLERALEVKQQCDTAKVTVSPGMLASIFDLYIKLKDLPKAQESMQQLQQTFPGFRIDEHKLIDYAALLVLEEQLATAKQILETHARQQKVNGGDYVLKNIWNFLNNVAQLATKIPEEQLPSERNLTYETFLFLRKLRYCGTHNTVLGPIVRERLLRRQLNAAVQDFRQLAQQFKHTPLQFELLSLLVKLGNDNAVATSSFNITAAQAQQLLTEVTEIVKNVHGVINLNSALLLAFAESGTDNQLRRLLINPEFRINQDLLLKNCEHLGKAAAVHTLLRLARGARGLNHIIDEQQIYQMLLQQFTISNDHAAALELFERLEADDELKISQDFLRQLVNLLKVNQVDVPGNIALRAQVI